jgi:hypothetical protein
MKLLHQDSPQQAPAFMSNLHNEGLFKAPSHALHLSREVEASPLSAPCISNADEVHEDECSPHDEAWQSGNRPDLKCLAGID